MAECSVIALAATEITAVPFIVSHRLALLPMGGLLGGGMLLGLAAGYFFRPSLPAVAAEVDRQLHLHELLSTLMNAAPKTDVQFASALAHQADLVVSNAQQSPINLRRLSAGAWGGVGLGAAIVVTLALIQTPTKISPTALVAGNAGAAFLSDTIAARVTAKPNEGESFRATDSDVEASAAEFDGSAAATAASASRTLPTEGAAAGRTAKALADRLDAFASADADAATKRQAGGDFSGTAARASISPASTPTDFDSVPAAGALRTIDPNDVPANYRDLVKAYFSSTSR